MKDHERTQLSYVAQALVRVPAAQWPSILKDAEHGLDESSSLFEALQAIRAATQKHLDLKRVANSLVESEEESAVTAGRVLLWSLAQLSSQAHESAPLH